MRLGLCSKAVSQRTHRLSRPFPLAAVLVCLVSLATAPARSHAQSPPPLPAWANNIEHRSLADYVDKLNWDAATRGPLLIVSPEESNVSLSQFVGEAPGMSALRKNVPQPTADGSFDTATVAEYFSRKPVGFGSLTVLAPTTMTVLNYRDLPKPNAYAAMSQGAKVRVLEATLTPAQWQKLGSEEGIGVGDLTPEQSEVFLSLLPYPFVLRPLLSDGAWDFNTPDMPLSPEQRLGVRLSLTKQMDWAFSRGENAGIGGNSRSVLRHGTARVKDDSTFLSRSAFGTPLATVLPNRVKTTQLPESLRENDTPIAFGENATVGELVRQIVRKTGAELLCDPRYASRKLAGRGRGSLVRAGDLLRALAYALTATWRHVGSAYVLTDDMEGLGVRHARIADWIGLNTLLTEEAQRRADQALAGVREVDRAGWSASDPVCPNEALIAKLDAFAQRNPVSISAPQGLFVPLAELPATLQNAISDGLPNARQLNAEHPFIPSPGAKPAEVRADGAIIVPALLADFVIPGYGKIPADSIQGFLPTAAVMAQIYPRLGQRDRFTAGAIAFPKASAPMRALLIAPRTEEEVAHAVQEARRCGFTELWIQIPHGDTSRLSQAIALASANHIAVRAVIRPFQAATSDNPANLERNIFGETTTEYTKRKRNELQALEVPDLTQREMYRRDVTSVGNAYAEAWRSVAAASRLLEKGDYLRGDLPLVQRQIVSDLSHVAAIPGIAGLVLRDATPLTYRSPDGAYGEISSTEGLATPNAIHDPLLQLGFSEAERLACLRDYGFDPIDASPLELGDRVTTENIGNPEGVSIDLALPWFHDIGTRAATDPRDTFRYQEAKVSHSFSEARKAWLQGRDESTIRLLHSIVEGVRAQFPNLPIAMSSEEKPDTDEFWFGSLDLPGTQRVLNPADAPHPLAPASKDYWVDKFAQLRQQAFAESSKAYYALTVASEQSDPAAADREALARLSFGLSEARDWDGIVVDLTQMPSGRASVLLQAMPSATPH